MDSNQKASLIQAAKQGDQQAIAELYRLHVQAIYRYVYVRVNQVSVAEDITSEVFLRAIETLSNYEKRKVPFLGWLYRIAHGKVIDYYRRMARRSGDQSFEETTLTVDDDVEQNVIDHAQHEQLLEHIQQLTDIQQQVIMMRFVQGHNLRTTAKLIGKSEGAVKGLQFRALQALAQLFEEEEMADNG